MSKKRLTALEQERRRLARLRERVRSKERRKVSVSMIDICPTCGRRHDKVTHINGAIMVPVPVIVASVTTSEKGSEEKSSTDLGEESPPEKISKDSTSTATDTQEGK